MKKHAAYMALAGCLLSAGSATAEEIPVSRVILSTSGLANFELRASVNGNAALEFPVRYEQVDDILKSLIVFDEKGRLGGVTLPGKQPLEQVFRDLPFNQGQLSSAMMLLNAYQGAVLSAKGVDFDATGKIVSVAPEQVETEEGGTVTRHRLSLMTGEGMRQAILEELSSLRFEDEKVRGEIMRALDAVRENSAAGQRMLTVNLAGEGRRDVALSYVVDAPLWKAAYRMVMPGEGGTKGLLQGWAVIENMTAGDWKDVELTLVSGNPVTYRQALYESYYVQRPEIPVQVFGRVMPRVDDGAVATAAMAEGAMYDAAPEESRVQGLMKQRAPAPMAMADSMMAGGIAPAMAPAGMGTVAHAVNAAQSAEATTQVLFRFPDRFTLKSGQSMMLPFVSREVPMERVSLYQPETHATHPLAAVVLENNGDSGLPPGIVTLYEESAALKGTGFVGDAELPVLSQGEERMVSYALDSKTTVDRADKSTSTEGKVAISQGVMRVSVVSRMETSYTVKAPAKEARTVVIEHPRQHDYTLVTPDPKDVKMTDTHYRLRVPVKAGKTAKVAVALERQLWNSYSIESMPTPMLEAYAASQGQLEPETRRVFARLAAARREVDVFDEKIREVERKKQEIFQDQERVRENLKSLEGKSDVQQRYLKKLDEQEDQIAGLESQRAELEEGRAEKLADLKELIADVDL